MEERINFVRIIDLFEAKNQSKNWPNYSTQPVFSRRIVGKFLNSKKKSYFLNWNTFQKMSSQLLNRDRKYWGKLLNSFQDVSEKVFVLDFQKTEASPIHCHHHHPVPTTTTTITNITIHHPNHHHHLLWTILKSTKKAVNVISVMYTSKMNKQL